MWQFTHSIITHKTAEQIWKLYASPETWNTWDHETEWARLNGPFEAGSTIDFKPKSGGKIVTLIARCVPLQQVTDKTKLPLATLVFDHVLEQRNEGLLVTHTITITGPLTFIWKRVIGYKIAEGLPVSMQNLVNAA